MTNAFDTTRIVHAVDFFFDALAWTRSFHRKPHVATTHGGFFHTQRNALLKRVGLNSGTRLSARQHDGVACCGANDFALFSPLPGARCRLIEIGVDLSRFGDAASAVQQVFQDLVSPPSLRGDAIRLAQQHDWSIASTAYDDLYRDALWPSV